MNKELREDLEHLIICKDKSITQDLRDDIKITLDYIDNLEEEKEKYKRYVNDNFLYTYEELQDKVIENQQRMSKAIEYMKHYIEIEDAPINERIKIEFEYVIDILRGEDNDNFGTIK